MTEQEEKELKEIVQGELYNLYDDLATANNDIGIVAKSCQDRFGVSSAEIKKIAKMHYESTVDEKAEKEAKFWELAKRICK